MPTFKLAHQNSGQLINLGRQSYLQISPAPVWNFWWSPVTDLRDGKVKKAAFWKWRILHEFHRRLCKLLESFGFHKGRHFKTFVAFWKFRGEIKSDTLEYKIPCNTGAASTWFSLSPLIPSTVHRLIFTLNNLHMQSFADSSELTDRYSTIPSEFPLELPKLRVLILPEIVAVLDAGNRKSVHGQRSHLFAFKIPCWCVWEVKPKADRCNREVLQQLLWGTWRALLDL